MTETGKLPRPYYQDDAVSIYHADCRAVLPQIDIVDHTITDPPYESEAHTLGQRAGSGKYGSVSRPLDFTGITNEVRSAVGAQSARLSGGWILVFCQVEAAMLWRAALEPARYIRTQIWRKPDGAPQFTGDRPGMGYESIVTCWGGNGRTRWAGGGRHGVYEYGVVREGTGHMTEKPIALMRQLVVLFTAIGDLILDPFMGSGTTLRAAKDLGRKAIGIEIEERYCEIAAKRMAQAVMNLDT